MQDLSAEGSQQEDHEEAHQGSKAKSSEDELKEEAAEAGGGELVHFRGVPFVQHGHVDGRNEQFQSRGSLRGTTESGRFSSVCVDLLYILKSFFGTAPGGVSGLIRAHGVSQG